MNESGAIRPYSENPCHSERSEESAPHRGQREGRFLVAPLLGMTSLMLLGMTSLMLLRTASLMLLRTASLMLFRTASLMLFRTASLMLFRTASLMLLGMTSLIFSSSRQVRPLTLARDQLAKKAAFLAANSFFSSGNSSIG